MSDKSKGWINLVLGVTALCAIVFNWFGARELTSGIIQGASTIVTGVARGQSSGSSATSQSTNYSSPSRSASAQPTSPPERVACRACNGGGLCPRCNGRRELTYQCALCFGKGGVKSVVLEWMNDFTSKMRDGQGYEGSRDYVQCPECKGRGTVVDQCLVKKLATGAFYVCSGKCLQCAGTGDADSYSGWTGEWAAGSADDWFALQRARIDAAQRAFESDPWRKLDSGSSSCSSSGTYGQEAWDKLKSRGSSSPPRSSSDDGWWNN